MDWKDKEQVNAYKRERKRKKMLDPEYKRKFFEKALKYQNHRYSNDPEYRDRVNQRNIANYHKKKREDPGGAKKRQDHYYALSQLKRATDPERRAKENLYSRTYKKCRAKDPEHRTKLNEQHKRYRMRRDSDPKRKQKSKEYWQKYTSRPAHKVRKRWEWLKSNYGISKEEYERMVIQQGGACKVCLTVTTPLCVDHDHRTKKVRDLLCRRCNSAFGQLKENRGIISNLLQYADRHAQLP